MMKRLLLLLLFPSLALAQTVPNGGITQGQVWSVPQWVSAWQSKADTASPAFTGTATIGGVVVPTVASPAFTGTITLNGVAVPTVASPPFTGTPTVNGIAIPTYPQTATEVSAGVTPASYIYPAGDARRYGADSTGAADSTAAMITAHSTGYPIYYPAGTYKVSSGVTIPCGGIVGDGSYKTTFNVTNTASADVFTFNCTTAGVFRDFAMQLATTKAGGYAIVVQPTSGEVSGMRFERLIFNGMPNGISFVAASLWSIHATNFYNCTGDCITINNTNNRDSGDSSISQVIINNATSTSANGVHQLASGGLKIVASKFNNGGVGYLLDLNSVGSTSDLMISACSFENARFSAIQMQRSAGSTIFTNIAITGNQFLVASTGNSSGIYTNNGAQFISNLTIAGNVFKVTDTGNATGITVNWVNQVTIDGNTLQGGGGATSTGILFGVNNVNAKVGVNQVNSFGFNINAPAAGTNLVPSDYQTGTANVTTSTVQGSLFQGTNSVTFPTAFGANTAQSLQNCTVSITTAGGGGGISAYPISISQTQFTYGVTGVTSGGIVPTRWNCAGIL